MTLSDQEIRELTDRVESLLDQCVLRGYSEQREPAERALAYLDVLLKGAPDEDRYRFACMRVEFFCWHQPYFMGLPGFAQKWLVPWEKAAPVLSSDEVEELAREGESCMAANQYPRAVALFDTIVGYSTPSAHYLSRRAIARLWAHDQEGAVRDLTRVIELEPDRESDYASTETRSPDPTYAKQMLAVYRNALRRDPTLSHAWIGFIGSSFLVDLPDWDEIISLCGQSKGLLRQPSDKALAAWLLCVALVFAGDPVEDADLSPLTALPRVSEPPIFMEVFDAIESCRRKAPQDVGARVRAINRLLLERLNAWGSSFKACEQSSDWDMAIALLERRLMSDESMTEDWMHDARWLLIGWYLHPRIGAPASASTRARFAAMLRRLPECRGLATTDELLREPLGQHSELPPTRNP